MAAFLGTRYKGILGSGFALGQGGIYIPSAAGLLLDQYSDAAAAYSVRKLSSSYSGSALRVRRSSDNAEQDIGFDSNGDLDTSALTTFVGANDGFVVTWYDQSGNGNNATQSTAANQPQIVSSGTINTLNSTTAISFDGSNDRLSADLGIQPSTITSTVVFNTTSTTTEQNVFQTTPYSSVDTNDDRGIALGVAFQGSNRLGSRNVTSSTTIAADGDSFSSTSQTLWFNSGSLVTPTNAAFINSEAATQTFGARYSVSSSAGQRDLVLGDWAQGTNSYPLSGNIQEFILYSTDNGANRASIESNINAHYNIYGGYTPVLDSMTATPQFAWSVYQLSSSVTNCFECRRSSDNAETTIGFDSNGLLDTAAISSHIGGGNGFSATFYGAESSRNGVETAASAQVQYRASGVLDKPCFVLASGTTGSYPLNTSITGTAALTAFILFTAKSTRVNGSTMSYLTDGTLTRGTMRELSDGTKTNIGIFNGVGNDSASAGGYLQNDTTYLIEVRRDASNNTEYFLNNVSLGTGSFSNAPDITTMLGANSNAEAELYEIVYFNSDISEADKATYIAHINSEYGLSL